MNRGLLNYSITKLHNYPIRLVRPACKRQQGDVARNLDRARQPSLMWSADSGQAARHDLAALGHELREQAHVLVVDVFDFLDAELTNLLAAEILAPAFTGAARTSGTRPAGG